MARVDIDEAGHAQITRGADGQAQVDLDQRSVKILAYQVTHCPVESGRLRNDLHIESENADDGAPARQIGTGIDYGLDVELGTGLFGKYHRRITPTTKKALHWTDASGEHFARSTKGQRPQPFIRPSLQAGRD